jgi:transcriptional regulator with XRE-family HTH domain
MTKPHFDFSGLGRTFAKARARRGLTTGDVAGATGLSKATVSRAERMGEDTPVSLSSGLILCRFYQVNPMNYLFHGNTPLKRVDIAQENFGARL